MATFRVQPGDATVTALLMIVGAANNPSFK